MIKRKDAVLEAAKELFGVYGFTATTFKKIAGKAGVAPGLLAHHYGTKERLFLEAGLDVLRNFKIVLEASVANSPNGLEGVLNFCRAYLDFSLDSNSNWLVLVRCSPYSDMKISSNQAMMETQFSGIHRILEGEIERGIEDGSIQTEDCKATAQVIMATLVGANRTKVLTPYASSTLYKDVPEFIAKAIKNI